ncbi:MAG: glycoside hydrolase family 75 protein, partial [Terrimicrobiaceae bacterium]
AFPAILGDSGPSHKAGEASLLLCRELNGNSSNLSRPISDLKVAYVVFPGSAEPENTPPDLEKWQAKCQTLIDELGGLGVPLHTWPNRVPPWPTPTPSPEPTPAPSPQESLTPSPEVR